MTSLIDLITPTNLDAEREKFFASPTYNPTFHYIWQDQDMEPKFSIKLKYPLWEAIKTQNLQEIVRAAERVFEVEIDESIVNHATIIAKQGRKISAGSAQEIKKLFEQAFTEFDLDYAIKIVPESGFNVRPHHSAKLLLVSQHIHFEYFSMEGEVHHELVHVIRYRNGKYNKIKRSQRFLPTEEGLASWCQDNTNDDNGLAQHAMEYVASSVGLKGSLRDIYNCLLELGMSQDLAWKRACRHKFSFVNTSEPGDILKPAMYFANEQKVSEINTDQKLRLFVGKIGLDELPDHPVYIGLWPAEKIIEYFKL